MDNVRIAKLSKCFSPSAPIDHEQLFAGRRSQWVDVTNALAQKGQHAILFGERGVGKTSLSRVMSVVFAFDADVSVCSINCDQTMTFSSLWKKVLRELTFSINKPSIGFTAKGSTQAHSVADYLPNEVTPDDVRHLLARLGKTLIIIDELDRVADPGVTSLLADTIKTLSDHAVDTTLLLVGVADSVTTLIAEHESVERALVQVRMPRMSPPELYEIIDKGVSGADMTIEYSAREKIAALSQGLPHYTHLLAQSAAQRAALGDRTEVALEDVRAAIDQALSKAQHSIITAHHKATQSPRDNLYSQVLLACALAKPDSLGYFAAVDVRTPLTNIMGRAYDIPAFSQHLNAFCDQSRGPVLQRAGEARRIRFRFINPLLQPYVIMRGIQLGLIESSAVS